MKYVVGSMLTLYRDLELCELENAVYRTALTPNAGFRGNKETIYSDDDVFLTLEVLL